MLAAVYVWTYIAREIYACCIHTTLDCLITYVSDLSFLDATRATYGVDYVD